MDGFSVRVDTSVLTALEKAVEIPESVQKMFANELLKLSDPYTPFASGVLKDSGRVTEGGKAIEYNTPYANYLYHGKLMVDPKTRKGAFYSPDYGFWSRPGVPKELTDRDLQFQGAPLLYARSMWTEAANGSLFLYSPPGSHGTRSGRTTWKTAASLSISNSG